MKKFTVFLCTLALVFGMVATASAIPFAIYEAGVHFDNRYMVYDGGAHVNPDYLTEMTWTFDMSYVTGGDAINEAYLAIDFAANASPFTIDIVAFGTTVLDDYSMATDLTAQDVLAYVHPDQTLSITLRYPGGTTPFIFDVDSVEIYGDYGEAGDQVPPVPEPATMLLVGSGLVGLAGLGRKKFFKS